MHFLARPPRDGKNMGLTRKGFPPALVLEKLGYRNPKCSGEQVLSVSCFSAGGKVCLQAGPPCCV